MSTLGHRHTAETKAKMSAAHTGYRHTDEAKAKIAAAVRSREQKPEYLAAIIAGIRARTNDPERIQKEFWKRVRKNDQTGCWQWVGSIYPNGYGQFAPSRQGTKHAHRRSYEMFVGPIPKGMVIDHLCRNRSCVNPAHLEPVTQRENVLRAYARAER